MSDFIDRMTKTIYCDTCRQSVDPDAEPGRWRHATCPPPPYSDAAKAVFEQVAQLKGKKPKR